MPDQNTAISFTNVYKSFDDQSVLQGLDLDIPAGKITTILGPSGCGKSVTLRHINGIERADSGQVVVLGQDVDKMRENVRAINRVLNRGWYDLEIADEEFGRLADRMAGGAHIDNTDDEYPFGLNLT